MKAVNRAEENENKLIAGRYAQAFLDLADDKGISKETLFEEVSSVNEVIELSNDLKRVMSSPVVAAAEKKNLIEKIFSNTVCPVTLNFLKLLVDKNRFNLIESISKECRNEINKLHNLLCMNITSAVDLTEEEKAQIKERLASILNRDTELSWSIDSEIIGGLIFEVNDSIIDNSLRRKIQDLEKNMIRGNTL